MKRLSLRVRLTLIILGPLLLISIGVGVWEFTEARRTAQELFDRSLLATALAIEREISISGGELPSQRTRDLLQNTSGAQVFYHVFAPDGVFVKGYATPPVRSSGAIDPYADQVFYDAVYLGRQVRALRLRGEAEIDDMSGIYTFTVWQNVTVRDRIVSQLALRTLTVIVSLIATVALVVWYGVGLGLRPLLDLQQAISQRSTNDLTPIRRPVPVETQGIVRTLNGLLTQVSEEMRSRTAFISNAAHQLRNPIAGVQAMAEAVRSAPSGGEAKKRARELRDAARNATDLANKLLALERADATKSASFEHVADMNDIAQDSVGQFIPHAAERRVTLELAKANMPLPVLTDIVMMREAISNLIDNALQHGGPDLTAISVRLRKDGHFACVEIADDGIGMNPADMATALERFGQVVPGKGSGLGLPIAETVGRRHSGTLEVRPGSDGLTVQMRIPLCDPDQRPIE
jgi:two-component system sensor histidine kinase TctE